jgi:HD superfamily phosphodiesterase
MKDMGRKDELKAIELGKIWMKNSINKGHDYEHAQNVEEYAVKILKEFKDLETIPEEVDEDLVKLAVWWHDSYKSRIKGLSIYALFFEGREAGKIARRELSKYVSKRRLDLVVEAIKMHNNFVLSILVTKYYPPLLQILMEADNIEAMSETRFHRMYSRVDMKILKPLFRLNNLSLYFWLSMIPTSRYMRKKLNNLKKK